MTRQTPTDSPARPEDLRRELVELAGELLAFMKHHAGDPHLGADLAQDALAQALQSVDRLRDRSALRGWLFRIAINRFNDHVRRQRILPQEAAFPEACAPVSAGPERRAMAAEFEETLRRELVRLPERQRTVLMLHGVKGLGHGAIADLLGISPDAVKMSLFHGREKLRSRLAAQLGWAPDKRTTRPGGASNLRDLPGEDA